MNVDIPDEAFIIEQKDRPFGLAFCRQHPVARGYFTVRPEIAEQWIVDAVERLGPGFQRWKRIDADTQDLGIQSLERRPLGFVGRDLSRSGRCPGRRKEGQDYVVTTQVTERDGLVKVAWKCEVWGLLPFLELHSQVLLLCCKAKYNAVGWEITPD